MPWLGISGVDDSGSVKVTNVVAASPAHGLLKVGDIIMAIDGQPVSSMWSLTVSLRRYAAEETVELRVISYGQTVNMNVTLSATNDDAKTVGSTTSSAPRQAIPGR